LEAAATYANSLLQLDLPRVEGHVHTELWRSSAAKPLTMPWAAGQRSGVGAAAGRGMRAAGAGGWRAAGDRAGWMQCGRCSRRWPRNALHCCTHAPRLHTCATAAHMRHGCAAQPYT
jgi:hypothetical protein